MDIAGTPVEALSVLSDISLEPNQLHVTIGDSGISDTQVELPLLEDAVGSIYTFVVGMKPAVSVTVKRNHSDAGYIILAEGITKSYLMSHDKGDTLVLYCDGTIWMVLENDGFA